jgi:arginase
MITLLGVKYDASSSFERGAALGPAEARAGLRWKSTNSWTESGIDVLAEGILADAGDIEPGPGEDGRRAIEHAVRDLLANGAAPLVLGGDHSITYPVVRAMAARYPRLTIVHFDAHGDLWDEFEGDRFSHACPFARLMEERLAIRLIQIGIRTLNRQQWDQIARFGVELYHMRDWSGPIALDLAGPVYISLDLDVLDPAHIAGISHPEPGGLSVRDVVATLQRLRGQIVGADLVELNPQNDPSPRSRLVAAKLLKELIGLMLGPDRPALGRPHMGESR